MNRHPIIRNLLVFLLVCGGLTGGGWFVFSKVLHYQVQPVTSGSMEPYFVPGSRVIVKMGQQPPVGGVVVFRNAQMHDLTAHVYLGTNPDGTIQTWGIANGDRWTGRDHFTPAPTGRDIVGTVVYHTEVFTARYWTSRRGIGSLLLIVSAAVLLIITLRYRRREEKRGDPAPCGPDVLSASHPV